MFKKKLKEIHFLLFPPYFWLIIFFVIPLILILIYSFSYRNVYGGINIGFTFENYARVFDPLYLRIFLKSIYYALLTTVITLTAAYPIAYFMTFCSNRIKLIILFFIIVPFWTNFLIRMYSFIIILGHTGLINTVLINLNIINEPLSLMNNTFAVILGLVYWNLPFMILPLYAALDKLDTSLIEASLDLGASKTKTFLKITLPLSIPGLVAGIIFVFVPTLGNFVIPEFLGGNNNLMIGNIIVSQFTKSRNWPFGSALSVILIFIVMICISIYLHYSKD